MASFWGSRPGVHRLPRPQRVPSRAAPTRLRPGDDSGSASYAEAAAPRDFFAIFLEDDAPPTPLWRKNLLDFFVGTPACGWDIARLSARVAGGFQGSAALMVHSSYVGTLLRHMESEPIGSIDLWLTDLQRGSRVPRDKSLPAPLMAHSRLPVFTPVVGRFNSSFGEEHIRV